jgi:hypothetical protein
MKLSGKYLYVILFVLFFSCKKDKPEIIDLGFNYRPLEVGIYVIYQADSIVYDDFFNPVKIDTFSFKIKEKIEKTFTDASGNTAYQLYRYKKSSDTTNWVVTDVWFCYREDNKRFIQEEENIKYVKLIFPPVKGEKWDGNAENTFAEKEYIYESVHIPETINNQKFDSVVTVNQSDYQNNLIYDKEYIEKYAKNIGMIYKKIYDVKKDITTQDIISGIHYELKVVAYGKE